VEAIIREENNSVQGLFPRFALAGACLVLVAALASIFGLAHEESRAEQVSTAMGIDADPTDNSATSLGNIDACVSVATGQTFDVDIYVTDVVDLKGWQGTLVYEPSILRIAEVDVELFLASAESGRLLNISDPLPNQDGSYGLSVADMTPGGGYDGSGLLARVTLEAVGAGTSFLTLQEIILGDSAAMAIGDVDFNGWFDGSVGYLAPAPSQPLRPPPRQPSSRRQHHPLHLPPARRQRPWSPAAPRHRPLGPRQRPVCQPRRRTTAVSPGRW